MPSLHSSTASGIFLTLTADVVLWMIYFCLFYLTSIPFERILFCFCLNHGNCAEEALALLNLALLHCAVTLESVMVKVPFFPLAFTFTFSFVLATVSCIKSRPMSLSAKWTLESNEEASVSLSRSFFQAFSRLSSLDFAVWTVEGDGLECREEVTSWWKRPVFPRDLDPLRDHRMWPGRTSFYSTTNEQYKKGASQVKHFSVSLSGNFLFSRMRMRQVQTTTKVGFYSAVAPITVFLSIHFSKNITNS